MARKAKSTGSAKRASSAPPAPLAPPSRRRAVPPGERMKKYRTQGAGAKLVRVEVLVPPGGKVKILDLAKKMRQSAQELAKVTVMCNLAQATYPQAIRAGDTKGLDGAAGAAAIGQALIRRGNRKARELGERILMHPAVRAELGNAAPPARAPR